MNKFNPKPKHHDPIQASRNSQNAGFWKIMFAKMFGKKIIKTGVEDICTLRYFLGTDYLIDIKKRVRN
ncbi:MAG: hypothetical protein LUQ26_05310 [Methylococcaceae bacterium]|nr:hypothetical protein [Methylococcaceae bacterium]